MSELDFSGAMSRIYEATGCNTQCELAKFLGVTQSTISRVEREGKSIPPSWLITILDKLDINPKWVLRGYQGGAIPQCLGPLTPKNGSAFGEFIAATKDKL